MDVRRTSLLIKTLKIPFLTSVFIPCCLASFASSLSPCASFVCKTGSVAPPVDVSASGSPDQAAPTSHHLPRVVEARISESETRKASGAEPVERDRQHS